MPFHRDGHGRLSMRPFGAASRPRTCYVADITGQAILHVLYEQLMGHGDRIERLEEWFVTRLLLDDDGACAGCIARDVRRGDLRLFPAKSTILATGGAGQCYRPTTNASICTGDGIALAYRIGAPLMDMEMIQYHPTTLPVAGILITEGARGEGAQLLNARGERFMERYAPAKMELASRDVVARAEQTEIEEGRGFPDGTVALDITKVPRRRTIEALREIVNIGRDFAGVDITREPIHVRPSMHYAMGGVRVDTDGATPIPGLYAAGETACLSVHGANRLGGNSLLDTLVFGRRAGAHAAGRAGETPAPTVAEAALADEGSRIAAIVGRGPGGRRLPSMQEELGATMHAHAGMARDAGGLRTAHETVLRLRDEARTVSIDDRGRLFNHDVLGVLELENTIDVAEAIVASAMERSESRGGHFRTDFPERDDATWLKHIAVSTDGAGSPPTNPSPCHRDPMARAGEELLRRMPRYTLRLRRFSPGDAPRAVVGGRDDQSRSASLGPRRDPRRSRPRRDARHPLLLSRRDLRFVRRPGERAARPRVPQTAWRGRRVETRRSDRRRADGQHARPQGPHRRHGRCPLGKDRPGAALAGRRGAGARA